jgi:tetratricopeptide (TPR) repeat protein
VFNGDWEAAKNAFQLAQAGSTDSAIQIAALIGLGKTYQMSGDNLNALNTLRSLVEVYPTSPDIAEGYFLLGQVYQSLQRPSDAAVAYQSYLDLRPGVLDAYVQERRGRIAAGDNNGALSAYLASSRCQRKIKHSPGDQDCPNLLCPG